MLLCQSVKVMFFLRNWHDSSNSQKNQAATGKVKSFLSLYDGKGVSGGVKIGRN
jgi:hypothetical protein